MNKWFIITFWLLFWKQLSKSCFHAIFAQIFSYDKTKYDVIGMFIF